MPVTLVDRLVDVVTVLWLVLLIMILVAGIMSVTVLTWVRRRGLR